MNRLVPGSVLLALCAAFAGCSSRTNVSATGSTPTQFTHVFVTAQAVWFNTNGNAGPDDAGWAKFALTTPTTFDLVTQSNGTLGDIVDDLRVAPGTYNSILILPVDQALATTANAQAVGATYNNEADFVDPSGTTHTVQLVLPNAEKGIVIPGASLTVPIGKVGAAGIGGTTSSTSGTTQNAFGTTTTTPTTTATGTTSTSGTTTTVSFATAFDGNRDLHLFNYTNGSAQIGAMLSSNATASNLATAGGITGTITLTSLTVTSPTTFEGVSGRIGIQASAELVDPTNSHHYIVASAPVQSDGTFTIYPLPSNSDTPTVYDVVIHGPNIATIIIKQVSVTTTPPTVTSGADTTGAISTTTATGAVSLGTFTPRASAGSPVSIQPNTSLPAGAAVEFYQTLPGSGQLPYAIDEVGVDPFNLSTSTLQTPEFLSPATIDSGTYTSSGTTITITSSTPQEGAGVYKVGSSAPLFTDALSTNTVTIPQAITTTTTPTPGTTTPVPVAAPTPTPANGSATGSITASVTLTGANQYAGGQLLVSHNGAVIGSVALDSVLTSGGSVTVSGVPSGETSSYYLSAVLWNSVDPTHPIIFEPVATPVAVSGGSATDVAVTIN